MKYIIGAYSQIPYGASDDAYEKLLSDQIRPLLTLLYQNSNYKILIRLGINFFEWLENNHPEINMLIFDLCKKNQIEFLSSPEYDAILSLIPNHERSKFIEKTTSYIRKKFQKKPRGFFNSYQIFNPSIINAVSLSSIDYIVTSTYEQKLNKEFFNKPFYMEEMGKGINVFPIDDRFSKEVFEFNKQKYSSEKFISNVLRLIDESSNSPNLIMLNLDYLSFSHDSFNVFVKIYEKINNNCTLPSLYLNDKEINTVFYLPSGIYGRDFLMTKSYSVNQLILDNKKYYKNFSLNNFYRDITHDFKKNSDLKKNIDSLLMKSSAGSVYIKNTYTDSNVENYANKFICEIESKLFGDYSSDLPLQTDIVGDRFPQDIFPLKNQLVFINRKGAVVDRWSSFDFMTDLAFFDSNGSFQDSLKSTLKQKIPSLYNKVYELKSLDKKRQDVVYYLSNIEINKNHLDIYKRYRFNKNSVCLDIDLENIGPTIIKDVVYENTVKLSLSENSVESINENSVLYTNSNTMMDVLINFNIPVEIISKPIFSNDNVYKYHMLKISHPLNINDKQIDHLCINIKLEKSKEKHL